MILVAVPEGTAYRQIIDISYIATHTRKSLVKGERFIRSVGMAETYSCQSVRESKSTKIMLQGNTADELRRLLGKNWTNKT